MAAPRRREVWLIDFGMAEKTRPALVVSGVFADQDRALLEIALQVAYLCHEVSEREERSLFSP
jgi:mRNA-degrading endonuclease toxin of MazEF toxin-antitoxin module